MPSRKIIIEGGRPLKGAVTVAGAKNAAIKMMAASLLADGEVVLDNVPEIGDVLSLLEILKTIGVEVVWQGENKLRINPAGLKSAQIPVELGSKDRTALMLAGPLLYHFGEAHIPHPGGCKISNRPINRFIDTWQALGAEVTTDETFTHLAAPQGLHPATIRFERNTCMGTENVIISTVLLRGGTMIVGAAQEPEVDDLIGFLVGLGADVKRTAPRTIIVSGVGHLEGGPYTVMPDRNEVITWAVAAAMTGGDIKISPSRRSDIVSFLTKLESMKVPYEVSGEILRVWRDSAEPLVMPELVQTAPFPGLMTDWQPLVGLLMTQAEGTGLLQETIYTDRLGYRKELNRMGARVEILSPAEVGLPVVVDDDSFVGAPEDLQTVARISGPTSLVGRRVILPDLRAGATLALAALAAEGSSEILGIEHIERGYEGFWEKVEGLGGKIAIEND